MVGSANAANTLNSFNATRNTWTIKRCKQPFHRCCSSNWQHCHNDRTLEGWKILSKSHVILTVQIKADLHLGGRQEISQSEIKKMGTELKAQQIKGLNQSINDSSTRINALKQELKTTTTKEGRTQIKNKIDRLNKVQSELKAELKTAKTSPVTNFVRSGTSFAAMGGVAITGGYNLVQQAIANDGDLTNLDYKAINSLVQRNSGQVPQEASQEGMIGAALTSFSPWTIQSAGSNCRCICRTSICHRTWRDTDWTAVAAQTIGSTIGFF